MALSEPELEMLMEMLEDDPGADVFLKVGEELIRRESWRKASQILWEGLEEDPEQLEGWALLARAAYGARQYARAARAVERLPDGARAEGGIARIYALSLGACGEYDRARSVAQYALIMNADDSEVRALLDRIESPESSNRGASGDPFVSIERAEAYASVGRPDMAVRAYRRILYHNPNNTSLAARIRELLAAPVQPAMDLAEELDLEGLSAHGAGGAAARLEENTFGLDTPVEMPEVALEANTFGLDGTGRGVEEPTGDLEAATEVDPTADRRDWVSRDVVDLDMFGQTTAPATEPKPGQPRIAMLEDGPSESLEEELEALEAFDDEEFDEFDDDDDDEDIDDEDTQPVGLDVAASSSEASPEAIPVTRQPTKVLAQGTDMRALAQKVRKMKRRRSLFRK